LYRKNGSEGIDISFKQTEFAKDKKDIKTANYWFFIGHNVKKYKYHAHTEKKHGVI